MKEQLKLERVFNVASSFSKFRNTKFYQYEPRFNGVYLRNNLPKINNGVYVIKLGKYRSIGTHWIALYVNSSNIVF